MKFFGTGPHKAKSVTDAANKLKTISNVKDSWLLAKNLVPLTGKDKGKQDLMQYILKQPLAENAKINQANCFYWQ